MTRRGGRKGGYRRRARRVARKVSKKTNPLRSLAFDAVAVGGLSFLGVGMAQKVSAAATEAASAIPAAGKYAAEYGGAAIVALLVGLKLFGGSWWSNKVRAMTGGVFRA